MKSTKTNNESESQTIRVTVELPKPLEIEARLAAVRSEQSLSEYVAGCIRTHLALNGRRTPVFGKGAA